MRQMLRRILGAFAYRTTKRYNVIEIDSLGAAYYDKDEIMLHAVMQLVVDFVEIECSFMELDHPFSFKEKLYFKLPWWLRSDNLIRSRERGLKHLKMLEPMYEDRVKSPSKDPKIIKEVYLWWVDERPKRADHDAWFTTEFNKIKNDQKLKNSPKTREKKIDRLILKSSKIEEQNYREDTEMLKKIIDARGFMWT